MKHRIQLLAGFIASCFQKQAEYTQAEYVIAANVAAVDDVDAALFAPADHVETEERATEYAQAWNQALTEIKAKGKAWVHLAPYGDFDNQVGMQRVTKADAQAVVQDFKRMANIGTRMMGLPFFIGHPDHPAFATQHKDEQAYGRIKELEAREDGLYGLVAFNSKGKQLIEDETFHGHSVHWILKRDGAVWRPVSLKSAGFTNSPNLPVKPITAANAKTLQNMKEIAKALGLPETAAEAEIMAKIGSVVSAANSVPTLTTQVSTLTTERDTARTEASTAKAAVVTAQGEVTAANAKVTTLATLTAERDLLKTQKQEAETAAVNAREIAGKAVIDAGIRTGRITGAEQATFEGEFKTAANAEQFSAVAKKITERQPKLHIKTLTENVGAVNMIHHDKIMQFTSMVNARMEKDKCDYDTAHARVETENPNFFAGK